MAVKSLYLDFFEFLDRFGKEDPWLAYQRCYIQRHAAFFEAYWKTFKRFDPSQIAARVGAIKDEDYSQLRSLVQSQDPAVLVEEALSRCRSILPLNPEPPVYLFVGFFSAEGTTLDVEGRSSIALGLERFKDFEDVSLLVSHEYCHCAQRSPLRNLLSFPERPLLSFMVAEGLSVLFSEVIYPEIPRHRHLFLTPERMQWCQENQEVLLELAGADLASEKLVPVFFGPGDADAGLPPRTGYFVARQMLGHCLRHHGAEDFGREFPGGEELFRKIIEKSRIELSLAEKR
jgi:hypothetical protein